MGSGVLLVIFTIIVLVVIIALWRGAGGVKNRPQLVQNLLWDVKLNQGLVETFYLREKPRKFATTHWQASKTMLGFLEESLRSTLAEAFGMVEDSNQQIETVKRDKSGDHRDINVGKLNEPLARSKQGLEDWLLENTGHKELPPKYPSLRGTLFGEW